MCILTHYSEYVSKYGSKTADLLFDIYYNYYLSCGFDEFRKYDSYNFLKIGL